MYDKDLAKRFVQFRKKFIGSQSNMAELCNCSQKHISTIENLQVSISTEILSQLIKEKDLNPEWFFNGTLPMVRKEKPKENLLVQVNELKAEIDMLKTMIDSLKSSTKKIYADFYGERGSQKGRYPSRQE